LVHIMFSSIDHLGILHKKKIITMIIIKN